MGKKIGIWVFVGFIFYLIFSYYYWSISYGHSVHLDKKNRCYYNLLSDGFLSGMLNLSIDPDPKLLSLPNPYDHIQNKPFRLHDASLYKGKYYLYFGVVPALVLYLPCKLFTGMYVGDHIAILIFCFLSLFWIFGIFLYLKEKYFQKVSHVMILFGLLVVAFSDMSLFNLRRPFIYEVAISSAMFFLSGAIYFLCLSFKNAKPNIAMFFLASTFIGLSVGCRPHFVLCGILLLIAGIKAYKTNISNKSKITSLCSLFTPYITIIFALCFYNYLRFDDPLQFGNRYQLAALNINLYKIFDTNSFFPGLYLYLLNPIKVNSTFPFASSHFYLPEFLLPKTPYFLENVSGAFSFIPFLLLIIFIPICILFLKIKSKKAQYIIFPKFEFLIAFLPGLINLIFISFSNGVTMRYIQDFAIYLLISTVITWFYLSSVLAGNLSRKILNSFVFFLGGLSIVLGMALGITGPYQGLKEQNPSEFNKLNLEYSFTSEVIHSIAPLWGEY